MKTNDIYNIQEEIFKKYEGDVLHILNGSFMMEEFKKNKWINEKYTYISFNEAMCWGEVYEDIFSDTFIKKRVQALNTTIDDYKKIVLNQLQPLLTNKFRTIVLWFGDDMFCQINMLTILAYLEQCNFGGNVLFSMVNEITNEVVQYPYEMTIKGCLSIYRSVICKKEMTTEKLIPVMDKAISLYLSYRGENSEINRYITKNISKENSELIIDLLKTFPQYGLGDLQYEALIRNIKMN